ncbi:MAG: M15 family metallopeptidase [Acutalibacter sp.]|nr:M15 family metallopeptidase [Acutalibacter sp.]
MTEKTMERRRRYQQRHRRNTIATWTVGAVCAAMLVFLAAMGCMDYVKKLPPPESSGLPGLALGEPKQETPVQDNPISQPQEPTVYEDGTDWNLRLVNRWNAVPAGYSVNLQELPGGEQVDERIYEPLMEMLEAAREGNWDEVPRVISGYRTQEVQQGLYDAEVNKYKSQGYSEEDAKAEAGKWVAVPGTSEHQLGLAIDVEGATYDVFLWLQENSYKYGFIFRYPGSKTDITGTVEEVWHYRYVGVEAATQMYEQGLCLEEYVEMKGGEES